MNKAKLSTTIIVLLGLLLILPVFAAATSSITESEVLLHADYAQFGDDDEDFIGVNTESFTVNNPEGLDLTVKVTGLPSGYTSNTVTVSPNELTKQVTLNINVPHDNSAGEKKIGTIQITDSGNAVLDSADLIQETASMLDLTELEVKYVDASGKTQKDEFNSDDPTYNLENEVKPYTNMTFTFALRNRFDRDYKNKGELDEVELTIDVDDSDLFEDAIEDTYKFEKIEAGKEGKFVVTLPVSEGVGPDTYTMKFTLSTEDGEGLQYEVEKELTVEIQLDDDDIRIVKAELTPQTITICDKEASLDVKVHNFGSDDQDTVKIMLQNAELGLDQKVENIAIDSHTEDDNSWQKTFDIPLNDLKLKTYFLDLKTYLGNALTDAEVIQVEVKPCATAAEEQEPPVQAEPTQENTTEEPAAEQNSITGNTIKSIEKLSYTSNDYLVALMLMAIAVAAGLVVLMLIILFKEK